MKFFLIKRIKFYFIILCVIIILTFFLLKKYNQKASIRVNDYVYNMINKYTYSLVSSYYNNTVIAEYDWNEILKITKNKDNEILLVDFDLQQANNLNKQITEMLENSLNAISLDYSLNMQNSKSINNGVRVDVPFFIYSNWAFISNLGPKIPVKVSLIGGVKTNLKTNVKDYGLNNCLVEICMTTTIKIDVITPIQDKEYVLDYDVLLDSKLIQGRIPYFYGGTISEEKIIES